MDGRRHRRVRWAAAGAVLAALVVAAQILPAAGAVTKKPRVVVAVADTGVNPYHRSYHRPANTAHPCTWVEGFSDCDIPALHLSIGRYDSLEQALAADAQVWADVEPGQWYWIPGTNIIGAVCEQPAPTVGLPGEQRCIFDEDGGGTAASSAVTMENPQALLLIAEGSSLGALADAPVVPDIQSSSVSPPAPIPAAASGLPSESGVCQALPANPATLLFLAAGDNAPVPSFADCDRARPDVQVVGGGFPGHWDAGSWSAYDFASWMCRPVALNTSVNAQGDPCGTGVAAPTVAGAASRALLEVRKAQGYTGGSTADMVSSGVTRATFVQSLRRGAIYDLRQHEYNNPPRPGLSAPLPAQAPWVVWGYGWIDATQIDEITRCALGQFCLELDPEAERYNAVRRSIREETAARS